MHTAWNFTRKIFLLVLMIFLKALVTWSCELLAGRGNPLLDCPTGSHPNPHPHTALTPASTPEGSDVAVVWGGGHVMERDSYK